MDETQRKMHLLRMTFLHEKYGITRKQYWNLPCSMIPEIDKQLLQEKQYWNLLNGEREPLHYITSSLWCEALKHGEYGRSI